MQDEVEVGDVFKEVYNVLNEEWSLSWRAFDLIDEAFPGYSYHENVKSSLLQKSGYLRDIKAPHSIVHELTLSRRLTVPFSRHDEVQGGADLWGLDLWYFAGTGCFKSFKLYADFEDKGANRN